MNGSILSQLLDPITGADTFDIHPDERLDLTQIFQTLVEPRQYARSMPGSKAVRDRRKMSVTVAT